MKSVDEDIRALHAARAKYIHAVHHSKSSLKKKRRKHSCFKPEQ
jgi:hypothetical protein